MLKPYVAFLRSAGPAEGAFLVIAQTAKEAKRLAWKVSPFDYIEFTDLTVRLMRDTNNILPLANQKMLADGIPHTVVNPVSCDVCGVWGAGLTKDGRCAECDSYPGAKLLGLFGRELGILEVNDGRNNRN